MKRWLLLAIMWLVPCQAHAGTAPQIIARSTDPLWAGSDAHLPVGPSASLGAELPHALGMSEVKAMLYAYADRGYIRRPDMDVTRLTPSGAMVLLGFEKPGLSTLDGAPVIAVLTNLAGDTPQTDVWGVVLIKTPQGGLAISAADQPLDGIIENLGTGPGTPPCSGPFSCMRYIRSQVPVEMQQMVDCIATNMMAGAVGGLGSPLGLLAGAISATGCHGSQTTR